MTGDESKHGSESTTDVERIITERPVSELSESALGTEWSEMYQRLVAGTVQDRNAAWNRRQELWNEVCKRTDAEPPVCPECSAKSWSQEFGGSKRCDSCDWIPGSEETGLIDRIDEYWSAVRAVPETDS